MFKEILQIVPQISSSDLNKMESSLSKRFKNIAKGFERGLGTALKIGAIAGIGAAIVDKLLNPLKEVQEAMDKLLNRSEDLETFAKHFGTTSGNLLKLQQMAQAQGLDPEGLRTLMQKFQTAIVTAKEHPDDPSAVKNFVNEPDQANAFFRFMVGTNQMSESQREAARLQVFGERRILGATRFLDTKDFGQLANQVGLGGDMSGITGGIEENAKLGHVNNLLKTRTDTQTYLQELAKTNGKHGQSIVSLMDQRNQIAAGKEIEGISSITDLQKMQNSADEIKALLEKGFLTLAHNLPQIANGLNAIANSRFVKGLAKGKVK